MLSNFVSRHLFIGRDYEQEIYHQWLAQATPWIFHLVGMGGSGKSSLLNHFYKQSSGDTCAVLLDFMHTMQGDEPITILTKISVQTQVFCSAETVEHFNQVLQEGKKRLSELAHQQPVQLIYAYQSTLDNITQSVDLGEERQYIREIVSKALYKQLGTLGREKLVLLFDTCELLQEPIRRNTERWLASFFLPDLRDYMRNNKRDCFVLLASRIQLSLQGIQGNDQQTHSLGLLSQETSDHYLQQVGIEDRNLRERLYALTHGHPLCISLIEMIWQKREGRYPTIEAFPQLQQEFNHIAVLQFLKNCLDMHLQSPYRELSRYGPLLRSFDLPLLQAVFSEELKELSEADALDYFRQLTNFPYIEHLNGLSSKHYAYHSLIRELQSWEIRAQEPTKWKRYHRLALDFLSQDQPCSPLWYYHAFAYSEASILKQWSQEMLQTYTRDMREELNALLQVTYDVALQLVPLSLAEQAYWQGRIAYSEGNDLQMQDALASYEQALLLFLQQKQRAGEARVRKAIGDVFTYRNNWEAALSHYRQALNLFQQEGEQIGEASTLMYMGDVQMHCGNQEVALQCYQQALTLFRSLEHSLGEANILQTLGDLEQHRKSSQGALHYYEQARALFHETGSKVGEAAILCSIGHVWYFHKDLPAAHDYYQQALDLYRQVKNHLGEANTWQALGNVQLAYTNFSEARYCYEQAQELFHKVGSILGEATALRAQGDIQRERSYLPSAQKYYHKALKLFQQIKDDLGIGNCYYSLGLIAMLRQDDQQALEFYNKAYQFYRQIQDNYSQVRLLHRRSLVYEHLRFYEQALRDTEDALALAQILDLSFVDRLLLRLEELGKHTQR
jgi:tetratricopeptide (TPR) repeat protein/GTPase SAR1 family protein